MSIATFYTNTLFPFHTHTVSQCSDGILLLISRCVCVFWTELVVVVMCVLLWVFVCGMRMLLHSCHCVTCNSLRKPHQSTAFSTCEKCFCICFVWHTFRLNIHISIYSCAHAAIVSFTTYIFFVWIVSCHLFLTQFLPALKQTHSASINYRNVLCIPQSIFTRERAQIRTSFTYKLHSVAYSIFQIKKFFQQFLVDGSGAFFPWLIICWSLLLVSNQV